MTVNHKPALVVALERIGGRPHARLPALKELVEPRGDFTGVLRVLVLFELRAIHLLSQCHAKGRQQDAENCENSFGYTEKKVLPRTDQRVLCSKPIGAGSCGKTSSGPPRGVRVTRRFVCVT